ncbi:PhzF family phenazine biosynthesis protein [Thermomonas sp.]|jgi:PhzF family phenazine biosynthesis protein|uniref:PhzF family phenazine biosynthesis protein n=1 Tax=Thermomonas sp. TaxID=1971895 RepID=UPI001B4209AD|nr:PhzF family phenazine biosynthesis protein [Thermomonas sp.]MBK6416805.1 PhzF family phenazine biosynthesis protein [Thermomonas sp.]MBK7204899.1 PhzF family phenazine biosynthesis protein [Thermomonas sp.]MBK9669705.1 PhzF family phenazine biosynthesis protein [Thermomonas sp.]MBL0227343.1 PhzF family phenazine biosynthesis protein [Thermomonas sp.]MBP6437993.1 PhzF family phenazine biosynthesis protein [Thermomonas sp.]
MPRRYVQLDVFASRPGAGNPLAAVLDAEGMDTASMQALAAWLNLSETIYFLPPDAGADYRIRIFTPGCELPFAGHPSVGAAWLAATHGLATPRDGQLVQQCAAGLLPAQVHGDPLRPGILLRSPRGRLLEAATGALPRELAAIARPGQAVELWSNGPRWWLLEAGSADALRGLKPDFGAIAGWTDATGSTGVAAFAFEDGGDHQLVVRAFCPGDAVGVPEDPVTGSANAVIAARLHREGRLPGRDGRYIASQGRELGRDGRVTLQVDADGEVWIGGEVQQVIAGSLEWPDAQATGPASP